MLGLIVLSASRFAGYVVEASPVALPKKGQLQERSYRGDPYIRLMYPAYN